MEFVQVMLTLEPFLVVSIRDEVRHGTFHSYSGYRCEELTHHDAGLEKPGGGGHSPRTAKMSIPGGSGGPEKYKNGPF